MRLPVIRPARTSDVAALSELAKRTWSEAFGGSVTPEDEAVELEGKRRQSYFEPALRTDTILVAESNASWSATCSSAT